MQRFLAFLRLIRLMNLVIIFLLFHLLYYWYAYRFLPLFPESQFSVFPYQNLFLVCISVICITAGGYIINDYFDIRTDQINKPQRVVAGVWFTRKQLIFMNLFLNVAGTVGGFLSGLSSGHLSLGIIYPGAAVLLLFYSSHLKKMAWAGNLTVAFLIGFLPLLFYLHLLSWYHTTVFSMSLQQLLILGKIFKFLLVYGIFAFLVNLIREMVKDMEDMEGDLLSGARTIPVVYGLHSAKIFAFLLNLILFLLMAFILYNTVRLSNELPTLFLIFLSVHLILSVLTGYFLLVSEEKKDFQKISHWLKLVMFLGLCMPLIAHV